jgi:inhibitor of cysteine peptidase
MRYTARLMTCLLCLISWISYASKVMMSVSPEETSFRVTLPTNPTTGYQWQIIFYDKSLLELTAQQYTALKAKSLFIGSGGLTRFVFTLKEGQVYPAYTELKFKYVQPWNPESAVFTNVGVEFK